MAEIQPDLLEALGDPCCVACGVNVRGSGLATWLHTPRFSGLFCGKCIVPAKLVCRAHEIEHQAPWGYMEDSETNPFLAPPAQPINH